jgi:hypothetical protein
MIKIVDFTITLSNGHRIVMNEHFVTWYGSLRAESMSIKQFSSLVDNEVLRRHKHS